MTHSLRQSLYLQVSIEFLDWKSCVDLIFWILGSWSRVVLIFVFLSPPAADPISPAPMSLLPISRLGTIPQISQWHHPLPIKEVNQAKGNQHPQKTRSQQTRSEQMNGIRHASQKYYRAEMQMFKNVSSTFYGLVLVSRINYLSSRSLRIFFASRISSSATDSISPIADHFGVSET